MIALQTIRQGDSGPDVAILQRSLAVNADGEFGPLTHSALVAFQRSAGLRADGIAGPQTWAALVTPSPWPPVAPVDGSPGDVLVSVAAQCLGVSEGPVSNRGDRVDWLIRRGGFSLPASSQTPGPPWCGWFGAACVDICDEAGYDVWRPERHRRGLATAWWLDAPEDRRIAPDDVWAHEGEGLVLILVRKASDRAAVMRGRAMPGHFGVKAELDRESRTVHSIAGNSSGGNHATGTGAVARESYRAGTSRWGKVVGFVRVIG